MGGGTKELQGKLKGIQERGNSRRVKVLKTKGDKRIEEVWDKEEVIENEVLDLVATSWTLADRTHDSPTKYR